MLAIMARILPFFVGFPVIQAQLPHGCPSFVEDQAVHVVGEVGQRDFGFGALDADGADEHAPITASDDPISRTILPAASPPPVRRNESDKAIKREGFWRCPSSSATGWALYQALI